MNHLILIKKCTKVPYRVIICIISTGYIVYGRGFETHPVYYANRIFPVKQEFFLYGKKIERFGGNASCTHRPCNAGTGRVLLTLIGIFSVRLA